MYAAMFLNATLSQWETSSVIVHAMATQGVQGPYSVTDIIPAPRENVGVGDCGDGDDGDGDDGDGDESDGVMIDLAQYMYKYRIP